MSNFHPCLFLFLAFTLSLADNSTNTTATNGTNASTNSNSSTDLSCNGEFFSTNRFSKWGLKRPPYLTTPQVSSNLKYCAMFNNVSSCCDNSTDQAIADYYNWYKQVLANMTGGRVAKMKGVFKQYQSISINQNLTNVTDLNSTLGALVDNIKNKWIVINQQVVSCAIAALRLSVGLLCTGCSTNKTSNQLNGKILLNRQACLNVSLSCFKLVQSLNNTAGSSQDDAMSLTDTLTSFVGDPVTSTDNSSNSSAGAFGVITDNTTTSSRRFLESGGNQENKKDSDPNFEDPGTVINATVALFIKAFPKMTMSSFIICGGNNTDNATRNRCDMNPLLPPYADHNLSQAIMQGFQQSSPWAFIPIFANITLQCPSGSRLLQGGNGTNASNSSNGLSTNYSNMSVSTGNNVTFELHFLFTHSKPNQDMLKFLLAKGMPCQTKLNKINVTENTIRMQIDQFAKFFNASEKLGGNKQLEDQGAIKNNVGGGDKLLLCVFKELQGLFQSQNKNIFTDTCTFNASVNVSTSANGSNVTNVTVCNGSVNRDILGDFMNCAHPKNATPPFVNISGSCGNGSCIVCLDFRCFSQSFTYQKDDGKSDINYTNDKGRAQFKADPRVSLKTGKRIPDFVELPDISFLTNFNFSPPCNDTTSCSDWFCTKFLRGPVARLEKIYNPQDSDDDLDSTTLAMYANQTNGSNATNGSRLLQTTSTDSTISETAGVDFIQVSGQSGLDSTVTIDSVSTAADPYVNNYSNGTSNGTISNNNNTNTGGFGTRMKVVIGMIFGIVLINL